MTGALQIGPLTVPLWLMFVAGALVLLVTARRILFADHRESWRATDDAVLNGAVAGFLAWKITPLITRFASIREQPLRLLYYPGGNAGLVIGIIVGVTVLVLSLARHPGLLALRRAHVYALASLVTVSVAAMLAAGLFASSSERFGPEDLSFRYLGGHEAAASLAGTPTVVSFWATWCVPCQAQMPELARFARNHADAAGFVTVNLTSTESGEDAVRSYARANGYSFPIALDPDGTVARRFSVAATPTTFVLRGDGTVAARRTGAVSTAWLERRVLPLVR